MRVYAQEHGHVGEETGSCDDCRPLYEGTLHSQAHSWDMWQFAV